MAEPPTKPAASTDSLEREERIQARRARLRERLARQRGGGEGSQQQLEETAALSEGAAAAAAGGDGDAEVSKEEEVAAAEERRQVAATLAAADAARAEADAAVGAARAEAEAAESSRRAAAAAAADALLRAAAAVRAQTASAAAAVRAAWPLIAADAAVADEAAAAVAAQRDAADALLSARADATAALRAATGDAADDFQKTLQRQAAAVDAVLETMRSAGRAVRARLSGEAARVEAWLAAAAAQQRAEHGARTAALCDRKSALERRMGEARLGQRADDDAVADSAARRDAEECAVLKARLEEEVQALQLGLQRMRATYMLNTEKLDQNMKLLAQREALHAEQIAAGKAKINRLQDALTQLKTKSSRLERQYHQRIAELSDDFNSLVSTYRSYSSKFAHFRDSDTKKLEETWAMVRERAAADVRKLLVADRVIHERVLGLRWCPPQRDILQEAPVVRPELGSSQQSTRPRAAADPSSSMDEPGNRLLLEEQVLSMLCKEASFLIDEDKLKAVLDQAAGGDQARQSITIAALLDALHVSDQADVDKLVGFFVIEAAASAQGAGDEQQRSLSTLSRDQALAALHAFVQEHERDAAALTRRKDKEDLTLALAQEKRVQEEFWRRVSEVVGPQALRLWQGVLEELEAFQNVLRRRVELLEETRSLRQRNAQLRTELNQRIANPDPHLAHHTVQRDEDPRRAAAPPSAVLTGTSKGAVRP